MFPKVISIISLKLIVQMMIFYIFIMTQDQLRLLTLFSLGCLSLALFQIPTLICLTVTGYFTYRYIKIKAKAYLAKGLIELCPQRLKYELLNKSIFDFICSIWFRDSFIFIKKFFKILIKPLVQPIQPQNAIQALNDVDQETRNLYLQKGVVKVMPQICQKVILGNQRAQTECIKYLQERKVSVKLVQEGSSQRFTRDRSDQGYKKMVRASSQRDVNNCQRKIQGQWSRENSQHIQVKQLKRSNDSPIKLKKQRPKGLIHTIQNSLKMVKKIIQVQNIGGNILKVNSATLIKLMLIFWIALVVQVKYNQKARKSVIKMLYVMGSMITVLGIVGTSGILIYKYTSKRRNSQISEYQQ